MVYVETIHFFLVYIPLKAWFGRQVFDRPLSGWTWSKMTFRMDIGIASQPTVIRRYQFCYIHCWDCTQEGHLQSPRMIKTRLGSLPKVGFASISYWLWACTWYTVSLLDIHSWFGAACLVRCCCYCCCCCVSFSLCQGFIGHKMGLV